jgi:putative hydrolase of the HAD superfamily
MISIYIRRKDIRFANGNGLGSGRIKMDKKWVIFDGMGVIFEVGDDTNDLLVPYIRGINETVTSAQINELYMEASLGKITSYTFWDKLGFKDNYHQVEVNYLNNCLTLDKEFPDVASELKKTYNLALLSNDVSEWSSYIRQKHGLEKIFKVVVISGDVGFRKPSDDVYRIMLDRIGCPAEDCVFIDDNYKNLVPAMNLGMKGIKFNRDAVFIDEYKGYEMESFIQLPSMLKSVWQ